MPTKFASGKFAIAECDRCGFQYKLKQLKSLVIKTKAVNIMVCPTCWEKDQPQLQLGMYTVTDPQALRNPRPDNSYAESRNIQWGWAPVGGSRATDSELTPNDLALNITLGTVTVVTGDSSFVFASVSEAVAGSTSEATASNTLATVDETAASSATVAIATGNSITATVDEAASGVEEISSTVETSALTFDSTGSTLDSTNNTFDEA